MGTSGQSITLANSIIGVGVLAMPFCFQQCGVILATLILVLMGLVSRLSCYFLLKSALLARRRNYEFLAFHVFGPIGKTIVEIGIIGFMMGTCVAYFVVVGDLGPQIVSKMFHIDQSDTLRTVVMVGVSLVCVLPLGLLRTVDSLGHVSAATILFYFCLVIKVVSEAAGQMRATDWASGLVLWRPAGVLQCAPIFAMALFCQTQLFEIFESLPSLSLEKMNIVTKNAINICASVYFTLGLFGYIAFSSQTISGNILVSLSPSAASEAIKLGFVLSLAGSFPLVIFPCRASLYSFLYKRAGSLEPPASIPDAPFRRLTALIVLSALAASLPSSNVERVLGLLGASAGGLVCLVLPAAAYSRLQPRHAAPAKLILVLGLIIMVLGTYANLKAEDGPEQEDKAISQDKIDKIVEDFFEGRKVDKSDALIPKSLSDGYHPAPAEPEAPKEEPTIIKDSEVQPPNPVPPESQPDNEIAKPNLQDALKEIKKEISNMKKEYHPKNLKGKLENLSLTKIEEEKIKEVEDDKVKSDDKKAEDKVDDIIKQQELMDTIKQHGEEQKELIKEQKEILHEMLKTKEELKQNKKDVGDMEAKKLAVESIQKIANIAIQSLGGGSEKPNEGVENKKEKPLEKIANEAVQEIAIKAVESIVAINKIEEANVAKTADEKVLENKAEPLPVPEKLQNTDANKLVKANQDENLNENKENIHKNILKEHSHTADEPQSYKQGEDEQIYNKIDRNIPIAVALNGNANAQDKVESKFIKNNIEKAEPIANNIEENLSNLKKDHPREKRETDSIETLEVNEKCDKDLNNKMGPKYVNSEILPKFEGNDQILPQVDLNDLLSRNLPMDSAIHIRSLKSVEDERRG